MKKNRCSVYIHTNNVNGKVYIGITSRDPFVRWANGHGYKHSGRFDKAIKKYGWDSFKHEVVISGISQEDAYAWEKALIAMYDSTNRKKGYNVSEGGEGRCGEVSKKTKKILSRIGHTKTGALNNFYGRKHSEKSKEKMSIAKHNNPNTHLNALNAGLASKKVIDKPVLQFTTDGQFVARHNSITDASLLLNGKKDSHIGAVCTGKRKTCLGYVWKYEEVT